jgi:cytochrome c oxidase subunit II
MAAPVGSKSPLPLGVLALALVALALGLEPAAAGNGGFAPVAPESANAERISSTYWFVTGFIVFIFVLVEGLLVAFVIRYRRRHRERDADGVQIHGSTRLETMWTAFPVILLVGIATFVLVYLPGIRDVPKARAGDPESLRIDVSGRQFYWQFTYPNGVVAIDRMRVPVGRTVELDVTAPDWDVIHSWWIPALGGKVDAIPGTTNTTWFAAKREGVFRGQCAELCGLEHAGMLAEVEVMAEADFEAWLAERDEQQAAGTSELGEEEWQGVCAKCHGLDGRGGVGPSIAGSTLVADERAVEKVVRNGSARPGRTPMPPVGRDWSEEQMQALTGYLKERFAGGG